ncbi:hypothetical protein TIFTF001_053090, partial [Ficus carica]
VSNLPATVDTR